MISSAENDELELAVELLPVAPYEVGDELDCESCKACRNCCRMLSAELLLLELELLVLPVEDEPPDDDEAPSPPWPP